MSVRRFLDRIGIWKCWFLTQERGKPEYQEKKTQPTYGVHTKICTRGSPGGGGRGVLELIFAGYKFIADRL